MTTDLKKLFPCLRDEYQPINVFINTLLNLSNKNLSLNTFDKRRFKKAFATKKKKYANAPDMEVLSKRINELHLKINDLAGKGVKTILFEMPIHEDLRTSPSMNKIRSEIKKHFPKGEYIWLEDLSISAKETSDGIHLTSKAAITVTEHLVEKLKSISKNDRL